ncbi:MAG: D-glycero-beta-D-manno-heptose-7-phosphate kinase [Bacteroidetes bacterium]|nr:D-glycero-beta-D-manno-heptose-7-phosphate kinase [Bacteroidota bacterium]
MTTDKLTSLFKSFNQLNILIVGDVMVDAYVWGNVNRISPEAPVPIVSVTKKENRLGGAANVALNIKAMGANPILCAITGKDANGKIFSELVKAENLSTQGILSYPNRTTTTKTRIIGNQHQMLRVDEEVCTALSTQHSNDLFKRISSIIEKQKIDAIIFEDYDKGLLNPSLIEKLVKLANSLKIPTTVDPKKNNFLAYKNVTLFKPNLRELKEGLHIDADLTEAKNLRTAIQQLNKTIQSKITLITLSEKGVMITEGKNEFLIPAHVRTISDVSGAGDTVIAVATLCLAAKTSIRFLAALSNLAGGLVCEKVGVVSIDKKQLLKEAVSLSIA